MILIVTKLRICSLPTNSSIQTLVISTSQYYAASKVIAVNLLKSMFDFISFHPLPLRSTFYSTSQVSHNLV